jgi:hypothetical protein
MKNPNRETVSKLDALPNIGSKIASDLQLIGITHPKELIGKSSIDLYMELCSVKGERVDHCVIDVFMSAIDFMEGSTPKPWWSYTEKRKSLLQVK